MFKYELELHKQTDQFRSTLQSKLSKRWDQFCYRCTCDLTRGELYSLYCRYEDYNYISNILLLSIIQSLIIFVAYIILGSISPSMFWLGSALVIWIFCIIRSIVKYIRCKILETARSLRTNEYSIKFRVRKFWCLKITKFTSVEWMTTLSLP